MVTLIIQPSAVKLEGQKKSAAFGKEELVEAIARTAKNPSVITKIVSEPKTKQETFTFTRMRSVVADVLNWALRIK